MPIVKLPDSIATHGGVCFEINNGDLGALTSVVSRWGFNSSESALRFAIGILSATENGTLCQATSDGNLKLRPQASLLSSPEAVINN